MGRERFGARECVLRQGSGGGSGKIPLRENCLKGKRGVQGVESGAEAGGLLCRGGDFQVYSS